MIYTELTKKAMRIAYSAHAGQTDKSGVPYVFHPLHLAEQMPDEDTTLAALLHDVVEDSDITLDQLALEGFPPQVLCALELLTHDKAVDYYDYIRAIKPNFIACMVKLADLAHNRDTTRLDVFDERAERWEQKYSRAYDILADEEPGVQSAEGYHIKRHVRKETVNYANDRQTTFHEHNEYCPLAVGEEIMNTDTLTITISRIIPGENGGVPRVVLDIDKVCFEIRPCSGYRRCRKTTELKSLKDRLDVTDCGLMCSDYYTQFTFTYSIVEGEYGKYN